MLKEVYHSILKPKKEVRLKLWIFCMYLLNFHKRNNHSDAFVSELLLQVWPFAGNIRLNFHHILPFMSENAENCLKSRKYSVQMNATLIRFWSEFYSLDRKLNFLSEKLGKNLFKISKLTLEKHLFKRSPDAIILIMSSQKVDVQLQTLN